LLISPGFSASFLGKVNVFCIHDQPPTNACYVFESIDKFDNLTRIDFWYPEVHLWIWLNNHLKENEKVATIENRIYYLMGSNYTYLFMLDGIESKPLYEKPYDNPRKIAEFLCINRVKYILDVPWARKTPQWKNLPLVQYLGSEFFPLVYETNCGKIYLVDCTKNN